MSKGKKSRRSRKDEPKVVSLDNARKRKEEQKQVETDATELSDTVQTQIQKQVDHGMDPIFAPYMHVVGLIMGFVKKFGGIPEFKKFYKILDKAEKEYNPSFPPMSPITDSFFHYWLMLDLFITEGGMSPAEYLLDNIEQNRSKSDSIKDESIDLTFYLKNLIASRCGFFKQIRATPEGIIMREIPDGKEQLFINQNQFEDPQGIWLIRFVEDPAGSHPNLIITSPYIILEEESRIAEYMKRNEPDSLDRRNFFRIRENDPYYWLKYIVLAYVNYTGDRIYLEGIPDIPGSKPHE